MPADRKKDGLWLERDATFNIGAALVAAMRSLKWLRRDVLERAASARMSQVAVRMTASREAVGRFSGGNQQRVLLGRCLKARPRVLLLNDFTRGVDVKAKASIHRLVRELADEGLAICVTSSDLEELLGVADRIICMRGGRIVADRPSADFDNEPSCSLRPPRPTVLVRKWRKTYEEIKQFLRRLARRSKRHVSSVLIRQNSQGE